jgi:predicted TIM-barrel fold metal-dependent hydrolase
LRDPGSLCAAGAEGGGSSRAGDRRSRAEADRLGLRGAAVGASVAGDEFSDPKFHPLWAKAEELGVLIFIHPQSTPDLARRLKGQAKLLGIPGH